MGQTCLTCTLATDLSPGIWNIRGLLTGFTYVRPLYFENEEQEPINIMADTFTMIVLNSDGNLVTTLTLGAGLELASPNKLFITFGPPITALADLRTYQLVWDVDNDPWNAPILVGSILIA